MRTLRVIFVVLALSVIPLRAADQPDTLNQVEDRIISQEHQEVTTLKQYSPLVETYIQEMRADKDLGSVPAGDKYFLGRAELAKGVELEPLTSGGNKGHRIMAGLGSVFSLQMDFLPRGFLQMIYLDDTDFDRGHYKFDYVRREFLGEVRCLVFDVTPLPHSGKGRFTGRIWVEDQDYHVVRFNGGYTGSTSSSFYFHFDSWRVNAGPNLWLPAFIYSEESDLHYAVGKTLQFKGQTRLWGYNLGQAKEEEELSKVLVEAPTAIEDQTKTANDLSPVQAQRSWDRQAEDNVTDRLERMGLLAPKGDVDAVLDTVINNLEVTNNLDIQPDIRCRVLLTSTLESFTVGHTIVLSRGLIDVLPDEASLAAMLAHELAHVVLGHRIDSQYAFFDNILFDDKDVFRHFGFARTPEEEQAADVKAAELLRNSPYKDQLATAELFIQALNQRSKEIPNLISPSLGDHVPVNMTVQATSSPTTPSSTAPNAAAAATQVVALPLGGRVKMDPWNDELEMLKSKPVGTVAEREKMPFEVTPFMLYLTRETSGSSAQSSTGAVSASSQVDSVAPAPADQGKQQ
ncbi:MAG: M48 family metalloprotease [Candidatus Acidiferrales bacterium]